MPLKFKLFFLIAMVLIAGCDKQPNEEKSLGPAVRTMAATLTSQPLLALSGTIKAKIETPIAFQINGRIAQRLINSGQTVKKGQILFELDNRDLNQILQANEAEVAAARSALSTAQADSQRNRLLLKEKFISQQGYDRIALQEREAKTRLDAALSRQQQATNASEYANLTSPADGIVTEVTGETGQVVAAGQAIGTLAHAGPVEVEVFLPAGITAPRVGQAQYGNQTATLTLREVAGSADPISRTVKARYQLNAMPELWPLGAVARVNLNSAALSNDESPAKQIILLNVPIGALDERGQGPQVWQVIDGKAQPFPVKVIALNTETAVIEANLPIGTRVIALGTHLLQPGMPVREIAP